MSPGVNGISSGLGELDGDGFNTMYLKAGLPLGFPLVIMSTIPSYFERKQKEN